LRNPNGDFRHPNLRRLFLTCNDIDSFEDVYEHLGKHCPALEMLSLAENPLTTVARVKADDKVAFFDDHFYPCQIQSNNPG
jgi:Leucine-rich repeat (LRR) protein